MRERLLLLFTTVFFFRFVFHACIFFSLSDAVLRYVKGMYLHFGLPVLWIPTFHPAGEPF